MAVFKGRGRSRNTATAGQIDPSNLSKTQIKRATRTRSGWAIASAVFLLLTVVFLIVAEVGCTSKSNGSTNIYFISLNLQNVIPESVPNSALLNSIAQTIGLHDFYTVGLWGYCEGYLNEGVTDCSKPTPKFYFDPVSIIQSQLLAGASIQLPEELTQVLDIIRLASRVMFAFFLTGACLSFVLIPVKLTEVYSRWAAFAVMFFTFINAALVVIGAVVATVLFVIMRNVFRSQQDINIEATLGNTMFAMVWLAAAFALFTWIIDLALMCCCASRRDVRTGRKKGNKHAYEMEKVET